MLNLSFAQSSKIKVYFNGSVDNTVSTFTNAITTVSFRDTIVKFINDAQNTLDVCNYNSNDITIVNTINAAKARGVNVRYIGSATTSINNGQINALASSIPVNLRPADGELMHNKFIISDVSGLTSAKILTGSTNHTNRSLEDDYNNIVIIQDKPLAEAYKTEFDEMWGSTTLIPDSVNAKFGAAKTDNTPHNFIVDGIPIELYFSPSDNTNTNLINALNTADTDLSFAMLTFTHNGLGDAIETIQNAGNVSVRGVIHNTSYFGSEDSKLINAGADVTSTQSNVSNITHHKYAIVDATDTASNPFVITGSHNWSNSANQAYDENCLIIYDKYIANQFYEEFLARRPLSNTSIQENKNQELIVYPNPTGNYINILANNTQDIMEVSIYNKAGAIVLSTNSKSTIDITKLPKGAYTIKIVSKTKSYTKSIIKN